MNTKERVKIFCNHSKISVIQFEKTIGASNGYVNSISKSIGVEFLASIIEKFPNLSIEWLLTGAGEMLKSENNDCGNCEKLQRMEMELERERCINNKLCGYEPGKKSAV